MDNDTTTRTVGVDAVEADLPGIEAQRQQLQQRIDALRVSGALAVAPGSEATLSAAQWTNWSNG